MSHVSRELSESEDSMKVATFPNRRSRKLKIGKVITAVLSVEADSGSYQRNIHFLTLFFRLRFTRCHFLSTYLFSYDLAATFYFLVS